MNHVSISRKASEDDGDEGKIEIQCRSRSSSNR